MFEGFQFLINFVQYLMLTSWPCKIHKITISFRNRLSIFCELITVWQIKEGCLNRVTIKMTKEFLRYLHLYRLGLLVGANFNHSIQIYTSYYINIIYTHIHRHFLFFYSSRQIIISYTCNYGLDLQCDLWLYF